MIKQQQTKALITKLEKLKERLKQYQETQMPLMAMCDVYNYNTDLITAQFEVKHFRKQLKAAKVRLDKLEASISKKKTQSDWVRQHFNALLNQIDDVTERIKDLRSQENQSNVIWDDEDEQSNLEWEDESED
jgi:predicted  nucleic acid-binding Zn-ribbon protein